MRVTSTRHTNTIGSTLNKTTSLTMKPRRQRRVAPHGSLLFLLCWFLSTVHAFQSIATTTSPYRPRRRRRSSSLFVERNDHQPYIFRKALVAGACTLHCNVSVCVPMSKMLLLMSLSLSYRQDLSRSATILTDGFYSDVNPFRYFWERLKTQLSLESIYPQPSSQHELFVACLDQTSRFPGRVVGIVEVDNRRPSSVRRGGVVTTTHRPYMCNLAVDKRWRQRGMAKALIRLCEEQALREWGETTMHLRVMETNTAARRLYESMGYHVLQKDKPQPNDDERSGGGSILLMAKKLNRA